MLTDKCKKHIKDLLKDRYNIDCYRIVQSQENSYNYFFFKLICICENKGFEMLLTISRKMRCPTVLKTSYIFELIQPDIEAEEFIDDYDFTIHIDTKNTDLVYNISELMFDNPLIQSMNKINQQFSLGIGSKYYILYTKVTPIIGVMTKDKGWFNIKTVSDIPYLVGNLCSSFAHPKRTLPVNNVLFNLFIYGDYFNYVISSKDSPFKENTEKFSPINRSTLDNFEKIAFQEMFFCYSDLFNFNIEGMTKVELCELDTIDFIKYIEVQKMADI